MRWSPVHLSPGENVYTASLPPIVMVRDRFASA